jgi:hypothetical protein
VASSTSLFSRMLRAAGLQSALYEEVQVDTNAIGQALLVVILVSVATGIGTGMEALIAGGTRSFIYGLVLGVAAAITGWLFWALFTYLLGVSILKWPKTSSTWGKLLRTMGFASTPGILRVFAFVPVVGGLIAFGGSVWRLVATIVAVRQALDFSTWRAILTAIIGWLLYVMLLWLVHVLAIGGTLTLL